MKIKVDFNGQCILVPSSPVLDKLGEADGTKLRVLLFVLANPAAKASDVCDTLNITPKSLSNALSFWEEAGVIHIEENELSVKKAEAKQGAKSRCKKDNKSEAVHKESGGGNVTVSRPKPVARAAQLPHYTSEQVASYVNAHAEVGDLLVSCQQYMGKMFNIAEVEIVVGLLDYLHLDSAYILLLFSHCQKMEKKSLRYIEKLAIGLFDDGIMDYEELDAHLQAIEDASKIEKQLRRLFGTGRRALTAKEKDAFSKWGGKWKMPYELIEKAYEITVENTGGASVAYCNAVLEKWYQSGYTTLEQVNGAITQYRHDRDGAKDQKGSFETDDFFEAALRRSYGEENEKEG
ncbi:hypothetical protein IMSAG013_01440 [Clostridiales bacterium]|nr:DnaD domain protein [Clostridiales bacterium]GFI56380.1 hypothetical protein IMSAG013_01440 [Clostridiales bacterium]